MTDPAAERAKILILHTNRNVLILGPAGTGKTFLMKELVKELNASGRAAAVCAPTGRAALNVGGRTIHSVFNLPRHVILPQPTPETAIDRLRGLHTLFIDEISMVRADVFDAVERKLRASGPDSTKPFGGIRLVLVGDILQLAPVVRGPDKIHFSITTQNPSGWKSPWFFDTRSFDVGQFIRCTLSKNYRQVDPTFEKILEEIRQGESTRETVRFINELVDQSAKNITQAVHLTGTRPEAENENNQCYSALNTPQRQYIATHHIVGEPEFEADFPAPENLSLRPGAQVMICANIDIQNGLANGTLATVIDCTDNEVEIRPNTPIPAWNGTKKVHRYTWKRWEWKKNVKSGVWELVEVDAYTQFPLMHAWAFTIHKAQGQTIDGNVVIELQNGWAGGIAYVALSRVRKSSQLKLIHSLQAADLQPDPDALNFSNIADTPMTTDEIAACESVVERYSSVLAKVETAIENAREMWVEQSTDLKTEAKNFRDLADNKLTELKAELDRSEDLINNIASTTEVARNVNSNLRSAINKAKETPIWKRLLGG